MLLRKDDFSVRGFFYRHNIHPYSECVKRQETLRDYADAIGLPMIYQEGYDLEGFIQNVAYREKQRCLYCYQDRLRSTAMMAKRGKFDFFTSTLLYSKFQRHDTLKALGESIGETVGIPFFYHDFREGWRTGISESKKLNMYRQAYCGCVYSEKERYFRKPKASLR